MNEFDRRWQQCAAQARQAETGAAEAPPWFAARTWRRWQASAEDVSRTALADAAQRIRLALRALMLASAALVVVAVMELRAAAPPSPPDQSLVPHVEDVIPRTWGNL